MKNYQWIAGEVLTYKDKRKELLGDFVAFILTLGSVATVVVVGLVR